MATTKKTTTKKAAEKAEEEESPQPAETGAPMADAIKTTPEDKEAPVGKDDGKGGDKSAVLKEHVSQTDQAYLGAKSLEDAEIEEEHDFNATNRGTTTGGGYEGMSAPRSWQQVYRENATDIDIRAGAKPKIEKPKETE